MAATGEHRTIPHVPALDGIRGLAVAAVVAFHLDRLPGGYLGVDAFFVLSGYLITSLLLAERADRGAIRLGRFYARRARRLLPALLVFLVALAVWGAWWAYPDELRSLRADAMATLFYVANWHDISTSNAYWDADAAPSPLSHMWSLAIEEQFYVIWPAAIVLLWKVTRGSMTRLASVIGVLAGASAVAMIWMHGSGDDPNRVYLGTDTRAQGLLIGAALAAITITRRPDPSHRPSFPLQAAAVAAVPLLALAWWRVDGTTEWLYEGGLTLHAIGVAAVIAAVTAGPSRLSWALSWTPITALGRISYGLYLWHWPLIVWMTPDRIGVSGGWLDVVRVLTALAVSTASYLLIERPIRYSSTLTPRRVAALAPVSILLCALLLAPTTAPVVVDLDDFVVPDLTTTTTPTTTPQSTTSTVPGVPSTTTTVTTTTTTTTVPLTPVVLEPDEVLRVAYVGDSIGAQVVPYFERVLEGVGEVVDVTGAGVALCDGFEQLAGLADQPPHVVVIDHGGNALTPCMLDESGAIPTGEAYIAKYEADTEIALAIARDLGSRVLLLDQPAGRGDLPSGTGEIFLAAATDDDTGTVRYLSMWPAISPDGFLQSAPCTEDEPGCVDGVGELRSRPPGGHLEPLGAWRYALAIRDELAAAAWLG